MRGRRPRRVVGVGILRRETTWIRAHFVGDCVRLPAHRLKEIERRAVPFALYVEHDPHEPTRGLVLVIATAARGTAGW